MCPVDTLEPALFIHLLYALLDQLKRGEEDGVDDAGSAHRDPETSVHVSLEEFDFRRRLNSFSFRTEKGISLVDALGRVNGICCWLAILSQRPVVLMCLTDHSPRHQAAEASSCHDRQLVAVWVIATKGCSELFSTLVYHEVDSSTQRIAHYVGC